MKLDVISLFFNNESIISYYEANIVNLTNKQYDIEFILIYNNSKDNTLFELKKLEKKYINVKIISSNSNGCSLGKNIGIKHSREDCDYLFFLDSDITINMSCINECINNIYPDIKFVGYYGGNIDNKKYIGGTSIKNNTLIYKNDKTKYITAGCSLICKKFISINNLWFDEYYDPFIMQDVDFSFQVLKYSKITKLSENNFINHIQSSTTGQFNRIFYNWQLLKNSLYIMNKYHITNTNIFLKTILSQFINFNLFNTLIKYYMNHKVILFSNRGTTMLITKYKYLKFNNITYNYDIDSCIDICKFVSSNNVTTIIIDFEYYLQFYEQIKLFNKKLFNNVNIEIILDIKLITLNNYNKLHFINKIYTFYTIYELILKHIFKNTYISITSINYNILSTYFIDNKNLTKIHFLACYNEKYNKLYSFFKNIKNNNIKITIINNSNDILNTIDNNYHNIYIDLCDDYKYIKLLQQLNVWIISTNNYPNCELINENINGNIVSIETTLYNNNSNMLINQRNIVIDNIISFISNRYLL